MYWELPTSPWPSAFFNTCSLNIFTTNIVLKDIFHNNVYKADFTELSYPAVPPGRWTHGKHHIDQRQGQTVHRHCKKSRAGTAQAKHRCFLTCKHTMSASPKPMVWAQVTYKELMSYQLSRKDCIFCHYEGDGAGTCSRSIKEGQGKFMSSEMRQTMTAKSVWKYEVQLHSLWGCYFPHASKRETLW